jgi:cytosine deaminase
MAERPIERTMRPEEGLPVHQRPWVRIAVPVLLFALALGGWEAFVRLREIPHYILPAPSLIAVTLWDNLGSLMGSWLFTMKITFWALFLAVVGGVLLAMLFALNRWVELSLFPFAIVLQVTPIVAIAPLILIFVDSITAALLICAWIVAFFPILSNTIAGLRSADHNLRDLFRLYRASPWQTLRHLLIPSALPYFIAGLKIAGRPEPDRRRGGGVHRRRRGQGNRTGLAHPGSELPHRDPEDVRRPGAGVADRHCDLRRVQHRGTARAGQVARIGDQAGPLMQLQHLLIPPRVRGFDDGRPAGQAYDVALEGARVASITPVDGAAQGLLLPAFVDAHTHLDKNYTVERIGAVQGDLFAAIAEDGRGPRGLHGGRPAPAHDARARRRLAQRHPRHPHPPRLVAARGAGLAARVRGVARRVGRPHRAAVRLAHAPRPVRRCVRRRGHRAAKWRGCKGVLGAFVYRNADLERKLRRVFELARKNGLKIDFHVDEGLHTDAVGLPAIAELAVRTGHGPHVTCSHCCSLSVQPDAQANETLATCARAGLSLIALPTTNLYLQGAWDRTPVERGITRLLEASAHGLRGCIASDNVADAFYPYGSYDLLDTYCLGVQVAHLAPALDWVDAITTNPARAMGLAWDGRIAPGCPADLVQLAARNEYDLLSPAGRRRTVIRAGQPL